MSDIVDIAALDTATRSHHPDSPSSLQASEACPCFENEQRESPAAAKGTLQHKAIETRDFSLLNGDEEMTAAVQKAIEYEDAIVNWFRTELNIDPIVEKEKYLAVGDDIVRDATGREWKGVTGGFPDTLIYSLQAGHAHVPDWKMGAVPVTPTKDNVQGIAYALGTFQLLGPKIKFVTVHFYAPYQGWSNEQQLELYVHTFSREDIPAMELRIRTIIARKKNPNAKPSPKVDLCLWCVKKGTCDALHAAIIPLEGKYEALVAPGVVPPHQLSLPSQFAAALKFAGQVEAWAKAVKHRCADVVKSEGIDVPGYKLVRRADRVIKSVSAFREAAIKNGMSAEEFFETLSVSFGPIEAAVKAKAAKGQGAAAVRQLNSDLEELGATVEGNPYFFLKEDRKPKEEFLDV